MSGGTGHDWVSWHAEYEQPDSRLSQRLRVVQRFVADALDGAPPGPIRVLSLCAGEGRDILGVLEQHPRRGDVTGRLVELDPTLAERARQRAAAVGAAVDVVTGDASSTDAARGAVPADVVVACGIFGNVTDADIRNTVDQLPSLCAPGATVVWTRHTAPPDLTPAIRGWFTERGFVEAGFEHSASLFGVGAHRLSVDPAPYRPGVRLFTFVR